jgi:NAD(P)-dependent dehydrogenase (short-subunit alcohol dehydrogenase family)
MSETNNFAVYPSLRDRGVMITGGGSGIGAAMVELFAAQGSRVGFVDIASEPSERLVQSLAGRCAHTPVFQHCDLTDIKDLRAGVAELESRLGGIHVLVNNAANDDRHTSEEVTPEYWDNRMNVNLRHQFFATQAVAPGMKAAGGGSIVNMSSIAWMIPSTGIPIYVVAKSAVMGLTRTMAKELGSAGIRVNAVLPGAINTERQIRLWRTPEYDEEVLRHQSLKRKLMPDDVARLVLFLAADDSSGITSQAHIVDGGWV